ncbi:MAG: hypothetical protein OXH36_00635 [Bdellovibrionales bacterium]|nr:hypothetical protein [Bdellovibrionales bacterium]
MKSDTKTIYAQSSDIKSRTYLEYRKDMKQKAIAELEILPWLKDKIKKKDKKAYIDGSFQSSKTIAPLEDTRYSLFAINILEDLTQDILFYYGNHPKLTPINKIYQTIPGVDKTFVFIRK